MILAIDQGTTGSRAVVVDEGGRTRGAAYEEITQHFPRPGWVEHDAEELWQATLAVCRRALVEARCGEGELRAIGIANQRETAVAWDRRTGAPVGPAIVWQDRRTTERCKELRRAALEPLFHERTGLLLDPSFSGTKFEWMLTQGGVPQDAALGTVDAWLLFKLTGHHATDVSNASRTLLFDIDRCCWDEELCDHLQVRPGQLPDVLPSALERATTTVFGGDVPVAASIGDQQSALFGQACLSPGLAKNTYGTGSFVLQNAGDAPPPRAPGLVSTIAWGVDGQVDYALESSILASGAAVQWLRDGLGVIDDAGETDALARSLRGNDGVYFVPALAGLGAPEWDPDARGTIVGLTRGSTRAHLARAALEAIAYLSVDAVRSQTRALDGPLDELRVDGGATANGWLMQFQADVLGVPVVTPRNRETTVMGAAYLAGIAMGVWTKQDIVRLWAEADRWEPQMSADQREHLLAQWHRAVDRSRDWARA